MTTSAPRPSVSLQHLVDASTSAPQIAASGWTAPAAMSSRPRLRSTRNTRCAPRARASRTCRQPIGPEPTTTTSSPSPTPASSWPLRTQANGSATDASAKLSPSGIRLRPSTARTWRRHDHVLGEAAVVVVAHRHLVRADGHPAPAALLARAARDRGDHLHPVARRPARHVRADLDDLAGDLVAHDPRRGDVLVAVVEDLDVGAAGRAVADPDLDLVRRRGRLVHVLQRGRHRERRNARPSCVASSQIPSVGDVQPPEHRLASRGANPFPATGPPTAAESNGS